MQPFRIAQISDFHFTRISWNPLHLFSKRILGNLNWLLARKSSFSTEQLEALPPFLETLNIDRILLGGDFTTTSLKSEFELAASFVDRLPAPWLAVPGNHDRYTYRACREKHFYRYFSNVRNIERTTDFFNLSEHGVEAHCLGDGWWIVTLDTCRATPFTSSQGSFSEQQEALCKELLALIEPDQRILLLNHYPFFDNGNPRHALQRGAALEKLVQSDRRIKAYLHGHTHRHTIANLQPSDFPLILDSGCCANQDNGSWNLLTFDDRQVSVDVYRWNQGWKLERTETIQWTR